MVDVESVVTSLKGDGTFDQWRQKLFTHIEGQGCPLLTDLNAYAQGVLAAQYSEMQRNQDERLKSEGSIEKALASALDQSDLSAQIENRVQQLFAELNVHEMIESAVKHRIAELRNPPQQALNDEDLNRWLFGSKSNPQPTPSTGNPSVGDEVGKGLAPKPRGVVSHDRAALRSIYRRNLVRVFGDDTMTDSDQDSEPLEAPDLEMGGPSAKTGTQPIEIDEKPKEQGQGEGHEVSSNDSEGSSELSSDSEVETPAKTKK